MREAEGQDGTDSCQARLLQESISHDSVVGFLWSATRRVFPKVLCQTYSLVTEIKKDSDQTLMHVCPRSSIRSAPL